MTDNLVTIIPESEHGITRTKMDKDALAILKKLEQKGYEAYLVGGCIRDQLSGLMPKDYDIVTNAKPKAIMRVFPKSILVGRRFPLVHVRVPGKRNKIIEVATFRTKYADYKTSNKFCRWLSQFFIFGDIKQDAKRRDLTAQALYWRATDNAILDYNNGFQDIKNKQIKVIGDTATRFVEDPVRILRILRVHAKLGFMIDSELNAMILQQKHLLEHVSSSRLFGELVKSYHGGFAVAFHKVLKQYQLQNLLFAPNTNDAKIDKWLNLGFAQADARYKSGLSLSAGYLFAVILWPLYANQKSKNRQQQVKIINKIIAQQHKKTVIPKKNAMMITNIWRLQASLELVKNHSQAKKIIKQNSFRAAYDFLLLRSEFTADLAGIANKWSTYLDLEPALKEGFAFVEELESL